jgi:DNA polymerase-3 subunit delta
MVAIKPAQANAFLAKPDRALRAILLFGTDSGLVSERAQRVVATLAARETPPGEVVRIDDADLDDDPDRLGVELLTVPMFGGAKIVRVTASRRITAAMLRPYVDGPPLPGALVVEAANLRPDDAMRALFEKSAQAAAIGCYADEGAALAGLVREVLGEAGLGITPEAHTMLLARLGADRGLSRAEIDKLALYAAGAGTIDVEHVQAIVGDASELAIDRILSAAVTGDVAAALSECDRALSAGESAQGIIILAQRQFQRLHRVRAAMDAGRPAEDAFRQIRPPLYPRQREQVERQLRSWSADRLQRALACIGETAKASRQTGAIESMLTEAMLMEVARLARQEDASPARRQP